MRSVGSLTDQQQQQSMSCLQEELHKALSLNSHIQHKLGVPAQTGSHSTNWESQHKLGAMAPWARQLRGLSPWGTVSPVALFLHTVLLTAGNCPKD